MKTFSGFVILLAAFFTSAAAPTGPAVSPWESSVVKIEVRRKHYDSIQPWNVQARRDQKVGVVVGDREIVTPAEYLSNQTLVRLQKNGRGQWWTGRVLWVDHPANLAVVTVDDAAFWSNLRPARLDGKIPAGGSLNLIKWSDGTLEQRKAEFMRFTVEQSKSSGIDHVHLRANVDLSGGGWGEPLVADARVVALVVAQDDNVCTALPASFIKAVIEGHRAKPYRGLGYFPFYWQTAENVASLNALGLTNSTRGVLVTKVPEMADGSDPVLQARDVILQIEGFDVDTDGDYRDPEFGNILLEQLAIRGKWAGDSVRMKIWRAGREQEIPYRLPKYEFTNWLVPFANYDQTPEYLIVGGLVFQPLTSSYLREWGNDWKTRAPFRLNYYTTEPTQKGRPALVILSQVLPDPFNIGYQDNKYLVVEDVNGRPVHSLSDLREALHATTNEFHTVNFVKGDSLRRMVLAAGETEQAATRRVLQRYGIAKPFHIQTDAPAP